MCCIRTSSIDGRPLFHTSCKTFPPIFEVPLFLIPEQQQFKFCYTSPNDNLCNQTSSPSQDLIALKGFFFWCNGSLTKTLSKNIDKELLCLPVTLVPQLTLLTPTKDLSWNSPPDIRIKRAVFLPAVAGISSVTSVVAAGLAGGALTHSLLTTAKLSQQFVLAGEASIEPLASLQRQ